MRIGWLVNENHFVMTSPFRNDSHLTNHPMRMCGFHGFCYATQWRRQPWKRSIGFLLTWNNTLKGWNCQVLWCLAGSEAYIWIACRLGILLIMCVIREVVMSTAYKYSCTVMEMLGSIGCLCVDFLAVDLTPCMVDPWLIEVLSLSLIYFISFLFSVPEVEGQQE
jgi:hypothetical protein